MRRRPVCLIVLCLAATLACGESPREPAAVSAAQAAPEVSAPTPPAAPVPSRDTAPRIVFLGDSLTAGLGLAADDAYPALLQRRLDKQGYRYTVVNAGVSGDTSAGGVRRLDWSLDGPVAVLVVALGGNDALRGLPVDELHRNLATVLERATSKGIIVILAGMEAPPNNGPDYTDRFRRVYADLAKSHAVRFIPFLLQGVAGDPALNQADGIHPNARGAQRVADLVWGALEPALTRPTPVAR